MEFAATRSNCEVQNTITHTCVYGLITDCTYTSAGTQSELVVGLSLFSSFSALVFLFVLKLFKFYQSTSLLFCPNACKRRRTFSQVGPSDVAKSDLQGRAMQKEYETHKRCKVRFARPCYARGV